MNLRCTRLLRFQPTSPTRFPAALFVIASLVAGQWLAAAGAWGQDKLDNASDLSKLPAKAKRILEERQQRDETVWKPEVEAQAYEGVFTSMWDELRSRDHNFDVLDSVLMNSISLPESASERSLEWGIVETSFGENYQELSKTEFRQWLQELQQAGYKLHESEWHHSEFHPATESSAAESLVSFLLHANGPGERLAYRGKLKVRWTTDSSPESPVIDAIQVVDLKQLVRAGPVAFEEISIDPPEEAQPAKAQPVILYDFDGDGLSEIALGEANVVYRNLGKGKFEKEQFLKRPVGALISGIVADFNRNGIPEFVCIGRDFMLYRFEADETGRFQEKSAVACEIKFDRPQVFSAGDVDSDGDLDLWVGQYMPPYVLGQMPTPYYDANDGFANYLLLNDGKGHFTDATAQSGLAEKANRRTYSGSLVDMNGDRHLDLFMVSDFSGVDVFYNDGTGRFKDVTEQVIPERHTFGMSHALADYDLDGALDFYVIGMSSTTARRLSKLGLGLEEYEHLQEMRPVMGYGNRIYLNNGEDQYTIPAFNDQVARTGWSWGCSSFDFDNDGDRDIYVANGHRSGESCQDYCTTYWRHDIYLKPAGFDDAIQNLIGVTAKDLHGGKISWNGYEHNKLLMNRAGAEFIDVAWLMGVAFEADSRAVVTDDLDGDGRMDLLVTEYNTRRNWETYRMRVLLNKLDNDHHWIGVRLRDSPEGGSAIGALVTAKTEGQTHVGRVITGDSFTAQHAPVVHFGLGGVEKVGALSIEWADGRTLEMNDPSLDSYQEVSTSEGQ